MRILIAGEMMPGQLPYYCWQALKQLGTDVVAFDTVGYPLAGWRAAAGHLRPMVAHWMQPVWVNGGLPRLAKRVQPDAILVIKGSEIRAGVLEQVKRETGAVLLNWNPDNPLNPANSSADLLTSLPIYDVHFTWGRFLMPEFERLGAQRVVYLPFCYAPEQQHPVQLSAAERERWRNAVTFVGTWEPAREAYLSALAGVDLGVWGNHWHRLAVDSPLRKQWRGEAHGEKFARVMSAGDVTLNFIREQNGSAHNQRTYEAPACGAFMLSSRTVEQVELLGEDAGAAFFSSVEELQDKVAYYLQHPEERAAIARRGYEIVRQGNAYVDRMKTVLECVG